MERERTSIYEGKGRIKWRGKDASSGGERTHLVEGKGRIQWRGKVTSSRRGKDGNWKRRKDVKGRRG